MSGFEIAGIVFGVAGLYGSCVDAATRVQSYNSFISDSQALNAQFQAERLRLERPDTGVILMSGYTEDGRDRELASGGRVGFIGKPFRPADLLAEIRSALTVCANLEVRTAAGCGYHN